ncbi:ATP-binding cassette domain-containing protein [Pseudactinotalea sp. Z1739]|uniref:ATP-binding cassette domain-containing protein n=1 Tax=Pseudactinotalea sp. Z1739 TaxID=3413028 RepID=UPI003C7DCBCA
MNATIDAQRVGKVFRAKARERAETQEDAGSDEAGLRDLSLQVYPGQVLALLGHNGAGKTTAVRGLSTLLRFDRGRARVAGFDVRTEASKVRERIALVGQEAAVDEQLSPTQNLILFGRLRGLNKPHAATRARALLEEFGLLEAKDRPVRTFSGGMRRRLDVAAGMIVRPAVLFVDEPTTGLDPAARRDVRDALRRLVGHGTTVLLTTQYLEEADALADHIVLLARGAVVAEGSADDLKDSLGHSVLRLRFAGPEQAERARPILARFDARAEPGADLVTELHTTARDIVLDCVRQLAEEDVHPVEVALRKPSLDEVFLSMTDGRAVTDGGVATYGRAATDGGAATGSEATVRETGR